MADRGTVDTERFRVKVYQQAGPSRFSEEKMIADGINPDDYRVAGQLSPRIRITGKGEQ
jgi:hypothetical protein